VSARAPRRRLSAAQRREEILAAALAVFGRRGYHGASLEDVAGAAGVSKALIYEHFASKEDLRSALLADHAGELFRRLAANGERGGSGDERLRGGLDAFFGFVQERHEAWRMLFRDAADPELAGVREQVQEQAVNVIVALIAADPGAFAEGLSPDEREEAVAMHAGLLSGAMQALANWWLEHPEVPRERVIARAMDFAWIGVQRLREGERWRG
jgi:AcrR family transcriptional regulator